MSNEGTNLTDDTGVIKFPIERLGIPEEILFHCKA